ncbi:MAG TPA: CHASE3 domain-containing protein [Solirubrobacteraceae bacterium]|nr:CHASE3 domain-containing protein [Solirubrobacteraceae bacterium]
MLRGGLTLRTAIASGTLALLIVAVFAVMLVAISEQRESRDAARQTRAQLSSADRLLTLLIDLETGQRGFVITRKPSFLEPWKAALTTLPAGARTLARDADNPAQRRRARALVREIDAYIRDYSAPLVRAARRGDPAARSVRATEDGKRRVDALRAQFDRFRDAEQNLVQESEHQADVDSNRAIAAAVAGLVGSLVLIMLFGAYLGSRVARPIGRAAAMAGRLARGDLGVRTPVRGPAEVGELERAFNTMADSLQCSQAELNASRARVVAAADSSRRRIERDLHDGAQQRLVTLALELREAQELTPADLSELRQRLAAMGDGVAEVLDELQQISRGIHPAILSEGGIGPALKTLARRSAVPVELDLRSARRLGEQVELTAYFVVSEALANAAKHANASMVWIRFDTEDGVARIAVRDDGVGGAKVGGGSGLLGLADRVEAIGGKLELESPPGAGTLLSVELPIAD